MVVAKSLDVVLNSWRRFNANAAKKAKEREFSFFASIRQFRVFRAKIFLTLLQPCLLTQIHVDVFIPDRYNLSSALFQTAGESI
jgi:hypothetical protein